MKHPIATILAAATLSLPTAAFSTTALAKPPADKQAARLKPDDKAKAKSRSDEKDQSDGALVGYLTLDGPIASRPSPSAGIFGGDQPLTILQITDAIGAVERDPEVKGLLIRIKSADLDGAAVDEIGQAITACRKAGKKVHVFADSYDAPEIGLASFADEAIMQDGGELSYPGVHMEEMFLADTLALAGIKADYMQIGDYKGASEQMARDTPSPQWEQNISALLDASYEHSKERIASGRHLDAASLDAALKGALMADGKEAIRLHLIDAAIDQSDLDKHMEKAYGKGFDYTQDLSEPADSEDVASMGVMDVVAKVMEMLKKDDEAKTTRDTIAVLHIDAEIIDGDSSSGGLFSSGAVGATTIRDALTDIQDDDNIKGLIVRVDSPGGSAVASEIIWQGIRKVAAVKPVWTSVGGMAASGGYYVSVAGDRIYADPSSIVGSIGVVGGKLAMGGLYNLLKVGVVERSRGPLASMDGTASAWTTEQRDLIRQKMTQTYNQFVSRVKAGRKGIDIAKTAEGRLFTGAQAVDLKMVDKLGGLRTTVDDMAQSLSLADDSYDIVDFPVDMSLKDQLKSMLGGAMSAAPSAAGRARASRLASDHASDMAEALFREVLGDQAWGQVRSSVSALLQLRREPVVLAAPRIVIIH